jgi:hypothetical protein
MKCGSCVLEVFPPDQNKRKQEHAMVQALEAQLKEKTEQVATMKGKYQNVVFLLFAFVIGVVSGKMLM